MKNQKRKLVYEVTQAIVERHSPQDCAEFDLVFGSIFELSVQDLEAVTADAYETGGLPRRPRWLEDNFISLSIWCATVLVDIALGSSPLEKVQDDFDRLQLSIGDSSKTIEIVGELRREIRRRGSRLFASSLKRSYETAEILVAELRQEPVDLEIAVGIRKSGGSSRFEYVLHSPSAAVDFHHHTIQGPQIETDLSDFQRHLMKRLESLQQGLDFDGSILLKNEVEKKMSALGRDLYEQLFTVELRAAYRKFRNRAKTLQITSSEPWIPWELVRPYDDTDPEDPIDDDFLAGRFELTRWLAGGAAAPRFYHIERFVSVAAGSLPKARREGALIGRLGESLGVATAALIEPMAEEVEASLLNDIVSILHVAAHGACESIDSNTSKIVLKGPTYLRPEDFHGPLRTNLRRNRPIVFLNSCQAGRQGWSLTGLGGWAKKLVTECHCSVFVAPQWSLQDSLAYSFAKTFYKKLSEGSNLGQAAHAARETVRNESSGPSWLSFQVYGHPTGSFARLLNG